MDWVKTSADSMLISYHLPRHRIDYDNGNGNDFWRWSSGRYITRIERRMIWFNPGFSTHQKEEGCLHSLPFNNRAVGSGNISRLRFLYLDYW
jgi:hypothetical protein